MCAKLYVRETVRSKTAETILSKIYCVLSIGFADRQTFWKWVEIKVFLDWKVEWTGKLLSMKTKLFQKWRTYMDHKIVIDQLQWQEEFVKKIEKILSSIMIVTMGKNICRVIAKIRWKVSILRDSRKWRRWWKTRAALM